jgi:hypothetical protein
MFGDFDFFMFESPKSSVSRIPRKLRKTLILKVRIKLLKNLHMLYFHLLMIWMDPSSRIENWLKITFNHFQSLSNMFKIFNTCRPIDRHILVRKYYNHLMIIFVFTVFRTIDCRLPPNINIKILDPKMASFETNSAPLWNSKCTPQNIKTSWNSPS